MYCVYPVRPQWAKDASAASMRLQLMGVGASGSRDVQSGLTASVILAGLC